MSVALGFEQDVARELEVGYEIEARGRLKKV